MDVAANTTTSPHSFSPASKVKQASESEIAHGNDQVPGLFFNLLFPPNPGSVFPSVCTPMSCEYAVPLSPCCFPPNDSIQKP